jgi:hypothetical protein
VKANRGRVRLTKRGEYSLLVLMFAIAILIGLTAGSWSPCAQPDTVCVITPGGAS